MVTVILSNKSNQKPSFLQSLIFYSSFRYLKISLTPGLFPYTNIPILNILAASFVITPIDITSINILNTISNQETSTSGNLIIVIKGDVYGK